MIRTAAVGKPVLSANSLYIMTLCKEVGARTQHSPQSLSVCAPPLNVPALLLTNQPQASLDQRRPNAKEGKWAPWLKPE